MKYQFSENDNDSRVLLDIRELMYFLVKDNGTNITDKQVREFEQKRMQSK